MNNHQASRLRPGTMIRRKEPFESRSTTRREILIVERVEPRVNRRGEVTVYAGGQAFKAWGIESIVCPLPATTRRDRYWWGMTTLARYVSAHIHAWWQAGTSPTAPTSPPGPSPSAAWGRKRADAPDRVVITVVVTNRHDQR